MGCDIHMVVERRYQGRWVGLHDCPYAIVDCYGTLKGERFGELGGERASIVGDSHWLPRRRNYELFAALAGVRGENDEYQNEPRGVPDDASLLATMCIERDVPDGHSHSHMLMSEALPIFQRFAFDRVKRQIEGEDPKRIRVEDLSKFGIEDPDYFYDDDDPDRPTLDDYRLVFWFDN